MTARHTHAAIGKQFEAVFSVWSVLRLYNEEMKRLRESLETAVRRVGGWCEMADSVAVRAMSEL
jgi:hypothetical protein